MVEASWIPSSLEPDRTVEVGGPFWGGEGPPTVEDSCV
jgi:hypothetical protein